jgi:hexosaminidase
MKSTICIFALLVFSIPVFSQAVNIVPQPVELTVKKGSFTINASTLIVVMNDVDDNTADFFNDYLHQYFGLKLKKTRSAKANFIRFTTLQTLVPGKDGAYTLNVGDKSIDIQGQTASGTFCGMQTLIQLLPVKKTGLIKLPVVAVRDEPRFAYRGMHLDVGRHFFPVSFVKRFIDYLALHKFNVFHWHLTEDQGWRIEIKKYPRLTGIGAWRNGTIIGRYPGRGNDNQRHGGFYTQDEIREVVRYAAERFINIVPEIEMPGHGSAAIAAYPNLSCFPNEPTKSFFPKNCTWSGDTTGKQVQQTWGVFNDVFCAGKEETFQFMQDVIDEIIPLFPWQYIHVGGDECPKANWKRCPLCQQRMKENNLKDEHQLQSYFIQRMEKYINSKGKTLIGWDEILEGGLAPNAIVMSWRGESGGIAAAKENHHVIMTPTTYVYFDYAQSQNEDSVVIGGYLPLEKVYGYDPIPSALSPEQGKYIMGAQANLWTEYVTNPRKVEYMIFPRMAALSEVLWTPVEKKSWEKFESRLVVQLKRYDLWKTNYSRAYFAPVVSISSTDKYDGVLLRVNSKSPNQVYLFGNKSRNKVGLYKDSVTSLLKESGAYGIRLLGKSLPGGRGEKWGTAQAPAYDYLYSQDITLVFNKATGKKITLTTPPSPTYKADGAFTLVNGIQNEQGLARSRDFLGFAGTDCEAVIDLGKSLPVSRVKVHCLRETGSWIWRPINVEVFTSDNGVDFTSAGMTDDFQVRISGLETGVIQVNFPAKKTRYVKVLARNWGEIPSGNPGAGNKAWLFVDEVEIE